MNMDSFHKRLLLLLLKWRYNIISPEEMAEFNNWFQSLEDKPLITGDGNTIDKIEELLYKQFEKNKKPMPTNEEPPLNPLLKKK